VEQLGSVHVRLTVREAQARERYEEIIVDMGTDVDGLDARHVVQREFPDLSTEFYQWVVHQHFAYRYGIEIAE